MTTQNMVIKAASREKYPQIVFQPETSRRLQRGINQIADLIRPTLGPLPRTVAIETIARTERPELLDDGAVIARRIVELADRRSDPGAMLIRHALWKVHEAVGDGTATTAVLYQSVFNEGLRYVAAGGSPMRLRQALGDAQEVVSKSLQQQTMPIRGKRELTSL